MGDDHPNALAYLRTVEAFRDRDFETIASRAGRFVDLDFVPAALREG